MAAGDQTMRGDMYIFKKTSFVCFFGKGQSFSPGKTVPQKIIDHLSQTNQLQSYINSGMIEDTSQKFSAKKKQKDIDEVSDFETV